MAINAGSIAGALIGTEPEPQRRASRDQYGTIALDAQGNATVKLDGSPDFSPCTCMVGVHHGDRVMAHVVNHRIVVFANITAPVTDDATALVAIDRADAATEAADAAGIAAASAQADAADAKQSAADAAQDAASAASSAQSAQAAAEAVEGLAQQAAQDAADASTAAGNAATAAGSAVTAANKANYALSDVEKVVGTLNWIAEHGTYGLTEDTAIVAGKVYYTRSGSGTAADPYVYEVVANPDAAQLSTYYELDLDESVQQYLAAHLWLDDYGLNLSVDSANGYRIHQGTVDGTKAVGTYILNPDGEQALALTANGEVIGKPYVSGATDNESHMKLDYHSLQMVDKEGTTYLHVSDLRDRSGTATLVESGELVHRDWFPVSTPIASVDYVKVGDVTLDPSEYDIGNTVITFHEDQPDGSMVEVSYKTESSGVKAYTLGIRNGDAHVGSLSYAEGYEVEASGPISHAGGLRTIASGYYSNAEGCLNRASGYASHAEGKNNIASGSCSHAEGSGTFATGSGSHSEGTSTSAYGDYSHAQNLGTVAASESQTAIGKFNIKDTGNKYAFIIGNGTADDARSNALAVRWNGLADVAGRTAYPLFVYATAPDEADLPVTPCFVLATSDYGLWYYDGN